MKADRTARPTEFTKADKIRNTMAANGRVYGPDYCRCGCGAPKAARPRGMRLVTILKAMAFVVVGVMLARGIFG
jgi:hypothetical protein